MGDVVRKADHVKASHLSFHPETVLVKGRSHNKGAWAVTNDSEELTDASGAYLLLIKVGRPIELPRRFADQILTEGYYGYAGSAYGPGGIRARCRHHLGQPSKLHWHVDWVTQSADDVQAIAFPSRTECRLIEVLLRHAHARIPINGFGSTDCTQCRAHLVEFDGPDCWGEAVRAFQVQSRPNGRKLQKQLTYTGARSTGEVW